MIKVTVIFSQYDRSQFRGSLEALIAVMSETDCFWDPTRSAGFLLSEPLLKIDEAII